jgi:hypothetical protein
VIKSHIARMLTFIRLRLSCCTILVVGCNHGIQYREHPLFDSPQERAQKIQFVTFIDGVLRDNRVQFVGEEWGFAEMTNAHAVADANQVPWANINTSLAELPDMGIPDDYADGDYAAEQKDQWNRQREQVMFRKLLENCGAAKRLIVVCGFEHMESLTQLFRRICMFTESVDYRALGWYDANAFRP